MYRRALLASLSTLAGPFLAGCRGETNEPAAGPTAADDDDSADGKHAEANHSSDDDPADGVELLCKEPAHEISEDSRCASLDYVTWELWGAIRKDSARVARSVTGDPEPITLSDGTQIAQRDQRYEVTVDEHLVITPLQDGDESVYKVGDRVRYRWDTWTLATIDGDEATLEPLEQLTSLKITGEVGVFDLAELRRRIGWIKIDENLIDGYLTPLTSRFRDVVEGVVDPDYVGAVKELVPSAPCGRAVLNSRPEERILLRPGLNCHRHFIGDVGCRRFVHIKDNRWMAAAGDSDREEGCSACEELTTLHYHA